MSHSTDSTCDRRARLRRPFARMRPAGERYSSPFTRSAKRLGFATGLCCLAAGACGAKARYRNSPREPPRARIWKRCFLRSLRPPFLWLVEKECRELLLSRAWWILLVVMGPLVGMSFISAVRTYAEVSGFNG